MSRYSWVSDCGRTCSIVSLAWAWRTCISIQQVVDQVDEVSCVFGYLTGVGELVRHESDLVPFVPVIEVADAACVSRAPAQHHEVM
jgi:hypothetical protein